MIRAWLAALWYRLAHDPDPYVPEAAEAPDPVDEHFSTAPRVVAGSDLDVVMAQLQLVNDLTLMCARAAAGRDVVAGAPHEPSPEVRS